MFKLFKKLVHGAGYSEPAMDAPVPPAPEPDPVQLPDTLYASLADTLTLLQRVFHAPRNSDFKIRHVRCDQVDAAVLYIDGMADRKNIEDMVLRPLLHFSGMPKPALRAQTLSSVVLPTGTSKLTDSPQELIEFILGGNCAVLVDGCEKAVLQETQGYATRGVEQPITESVVMGPHQAFNENLRTNITLLRRIIHSPHLVNETLTVGSVAENRLAIVYLDNVANPAIVEEVRRRIQGINTDAALSIGQIAQLIEDRPFALLPQLIQTERPDRTASFLMDGMVAVLYDNSPYAIAAPATLMHFLHTSDDSFMRWQYGSFSRVVRIVGALISLLLPALYNAVLLFHQELLPTDLLTSLIEGHTLVPFNVTLEIILMELVFDLINEAGLRMPGSLGSTLGIIGALVLGQAAVAANLISPALIIVVALTGLGTFAIPNYPLSIAIRIQRFCYLIVSAIAGFVGIGLLMMFFLCTGAALESFGVPYFSPLAPNLPHNPDLFFRLPLFLQKLVPKAYRPMKKETASGSPRGWDHPQGDESR